MALVTFLKWLQKHISNGMEMEKRSQRRASLSKVCVILGSSVGTIWDI